MKYICGYGADLWSKAENPVANAGENSTDGHKNSTEAIAEIAVDELARAVSQD